MGNERGSQQNKVVPADFLGLEPSAYPSFENSGEIYWHKLGRASMDLAELTDAKEDKGAVALAAPDKDWFQPIARDERFRNIKAFEDPTGRRLPPNEHGHPDFMQAYPGYPAIPVIGQGDELGEPFTGAVDTVVLRHGACDIEVLLIQRGSGYYAFPGGVVQQTQKGKTYEIDAEGIYRQLTSAHESPATTARRALQRRAGIDLPEDRFTREVYSGILDDIRNSSGAAMYGRVFAVVDDARNVPEPKSTSAQREARFVPLAELLNNTQEPTLDGLWGCHAFLLKWALWSEFVTDPDRYAKLNETDRDQIRQVLAYDPLDYLLSDEVTYAAQNHWASAQWGRRLPWPVRGTICFPLVGGAILPGMERMHGHPSLVPAWVMRKARRLRSYSIDELIADLELHRDNHEGIPATVDFSYLRALYHAEPKDVMEWMDYLGHEALEANRVWVHNAEAILDRLRINKKELGCLEDGDSMVTQLLELKRQMQALEGATSLSNLALRLEENPEGQDFMIRAHSGWRETFHQQHLPPKSVTQAPYREGIDPRIIAVEIQQFQTDLRAAWKQVVESWGNTRPKLFGETLARRVTQLRNRFEIDPLVSGVQTFQLMLSIGRVLEQMAATGDLTPPIVTSINNQLSDLLYVIKMDANSAVITGILNAARKEGAKLRQAHQISGV